MLFLGIQPDTFAVRVFSTQDPAYQTLQDPRVLHSLALQKLTPLLEVLSAGYGPCRIL